SVTERPSAMRSQNLSAHSMLYLVGRPILAGTCIDRFLVRGGIFAQSPLGGAIRRMIATEHNGKVAALTRDLHGAPPAARLVISTCGAFARRYRQVRDFLPRPSHALWLLAKRRPQIDRLSNPG